MATPLEAAHLRNQQVVTELRELRSASDSILNEMPDMANYYPKLIAGLQRVYQRLLATVDSLEFIGLEGVCEVTFRSRTESLTWALDSTPGEEVAGVLLEHLRNQLGEVENKIWEAKGRLAGELVGGTAEEWHHENVHQLALLLEAVPAVPFSKEA